MTTDWETYILLVKGNIGPGTICSLCAILIVTFLQMTGCLSLPFCFSLLGPVWSLPVLAVTGFFCVFNMWVLIDCKKKILGSSTYGELGLFAFGKKGEKLVEFLLMTMQLSICTVYFSFMGKSRICGRDLCASPLMHAAGDSLGPMLGITSQVTAVLDLYNFCWNATCTHVSLAPVCGALRWALC